MHYLRERSGTLEQLNDDFVNVAIANHIQVMSVAETEQSTIGRVAHFDVVDVDSAYPRVGRFYALAIPHLTTSKPSSRRDPLFQLIAQFLSEVQ